MSTESPSVGEQAVVSVIVVTHQGESEMLRRCVASIRAAGGADHVVVVDNSGRFTQRADTVDDGGTIWLAVENDGFGAAVNKGVAASRVLDPGGQFVAVLNDDTVVSRGWLGPLVDALTRSGRIGAVQPKLLLGATVPPVVNSVGVELDAAGAGVDVGFGEPDGALWRNAGDIEIFTGGAVVFDLDFLDDVGGFDERYFLYYEDVDLAFRGAELGWTYRCEPKSTVEHWPGSTTSALGDGRRRLQERNRLWVAFRFGSAADVASALWLSIRRLRHAPHGAHLRALISGLSAAPRLAVERLRARRA